MFPLHFRYHGSPCAIGFQLSYNIAQGNSNQETELKLKIFSISFPSLFSSFCFLKISSLFFVSCLFLSYWFLPSFYFHPLVPALLPAFSLCLFLQHSLPHFSAIHRHCSKPLGALSLKILVPSYCLLQINGDVSSSSVFTER